MGTIYTHGDFDGIVSAAFVGKAMDWDTVVFTSPNGIYEQPVTESDVVCDLPYPHRQIGYWFDHHESNINEVIEKGIADRINGRFVPADSAAQVIFDFFGREADFPPFFADTLKWTNRIDAMRYESVDQWLEPVPAHRIDRSIFLAGEPLPQARRYMRYLTERIAESPLADVAALDEVQKRYETYREQSARSGEIIERAAGYADPGKEILVLDFSEVRFPPKFSKNLVYASHPGIKAVLQLQPVYRGRTRTNDIRVSLALNPFVSASAGIDMAKILRDLEVGDGHASAAGGTLESGSKQQRIKNKKQFLHDVAKAWQDRIRSEKG